MCILTYRLTCSVNSAFSQGSNQHSVIYFTASEVLSSCGQVGYPDRAVVPGTFDCGMLCIVISASFFGQMLLNHSFQIQNAAKGSSINCTQVRACTYLVALSMNGQLLDIDMPHAAISILTPSAWVDMFLLCVCLTSSKDIPWLL